jgi:hypothetical protein
LPQSAWKTGIGGRPRTPVQEAVLKRSISRKLLISNNALTFIPVRGPGSARRAFVPHSNDPPTDLERLLPKCYSVRVPATLSWAGSIRRLGAMAGGHIQRRFQFTTGTTATAAAPGGGR